MLIIWLAVSIQAEAVKEKTEETATAVKEKAEEAVAAVTESAPAEKVSFCR